MSVLSLNLTIKLNLIMTDFYVFVDLCTFTRMYAFLCSLCQIFTGFLNFCWIVDYGIVCQKARPHQQGSHPWESVCSSSLSTMGGCMGDCRVHLWAPFSVCAGGDEGRGLPRSQSETTAGLAGARWHGRSRAEQRRHTISNGVDYGTVLSTQPQTWVFCVCLRKWTSF